MMDIPMVGFGTARLGSGDGMEASLRTALLECGVRHVDCAKVYGNEEAVGRVLRRLFEEGKLRREEVFVTTKLWNDDHANVAAACEASLKRLQLDYVDLYLIHWPVAWKKFTVFVPDRSVMLRETWGAMEALVDLGLTKRIGVSNFERGQLESILSTARVRPYVNQIELHPRLQQPRLVQFCMDHDIRVVAWSPLGKYHSFISQDPTLLSIARKRGKSVTSVVLRWHLQRGVITIARSSNPAHVKQNVEEPTTFELTEEEMEEIRRLDTGTRVTRDWIGVFEESTPRFPYFFIGAIVRAFFTVFFLVVPYKLDLKAPQ